jgi:hypothetical protein
MAKFRRTKSKATKEDIISALAQGYGFAEACRIKSLPKSTGYYWRQQDKDFDEQCKRLLSSPEHQLRTSKALAKVEVDDEDDWRKKFVIWYRKTKSKSEACRYVEKSPLVIEEMLDVSSESHDEEFYKLMREAEILDVWDIERSAIDAAVTGADRPTQRFMLERLLPDKYKPARSGNVLEAGSINFWFSSEGEKKALSTLNEMFLDI